MANCCAHARPWRCADLWICLICGHVGCGRYRGSHAASHWQSSGHGYALELETQVGGGLWSGWRLGLYIRLQTEGLWQARRHGSALWVQTCSDGRVPGAEGTFV